MEKYMLRSRHLHLAGLALLIVLGLTVQPMATPTTHIWGPSTDIQPFKVLHVGHDLYVPDSKTADGQRIPSINNLGLTIGILPGKKLNAEVGFDYRSGLGILDDYPLYFNGKVGIPENAFAPWFPAIGLGLYDFGTKKDMTTYNLYYAKIARTIPGGKNTLGRLSLGYFVGNEKLLLDDNGKKDNSGIMLAWERTMTEWSSKLWLCAEYQGSKSGYGTFNVGAAWKFTDNIAVIAGYDIYNASNLANTFTWQLDIDIR
jgi:hypothetical protein